MGGHEEALRESVKIKSNHGNNEIHRLKKQIFTVLFGHAGHQRGCFLITEEVRRQETSQQRLTHTVNSLIGSVPIRKDLSAETVFSFFGLAKQTEKISAMRPLLGETSLFYLERCTERMSCPVWLEKVQRL